MKNRTKPFSAFLFALIALIFVSCGDIMNNQNTPAEDTFDVKVLPAFLLSSGIKFSTEQDISCTAKLYTQDASGALNVQKQAFSGSLKKLLESSSFTFENPEIEDKYYVKITLSLNDDSGVRHTLQGRSDPAVFTKGENSVEIKMEPAPTTDIVFFSSDASGSTKKISENDLFQLTDPLSTEHGQTVNYVSYNFCFDSRGSLFGLTEGRETQIKGFTTDADASNVIAIKSNGDEIWTLCEDIGNKKRFLKNLGNDGNGDATVETEMGMTGPTTFAVKGDYAYLPITAGSGAEQYLTIQRVSLKNPSATNNPTISLKADALELENPTNLKIFDMHIQQGTLYILLNGMHDDNDTENNACRGGIAQILLSSFDKENGTVETWRTGEKVLGWSSEKFLDGTYTNKFYGPIRFIALKPDELVIADDGFYYDERKNRKHKRGIVFLDLDELSMRYKEGQAENNYRLFLGRVSTFFEY